jgi:hypothetical protein
MELTTRMHGGPDAQDAAMQALDAVEASRP